VRIAVIGGGLTGLTAAWRLTLAGHEATVIEASHRLGGFIQTEASGGWLAEAGPSSFIDSSPAAAAVIKDLGLSGQRIESSPAASNRYVVMGGQLVPLPRPSDAAALVSTPLFSMRAKLRITAEAARTPIERESDLSVADIVREHFGTEILERLVQPFVGGIYAGDPERLSARHAFPKLWEAERTVGSLLRAGMAGAREREQLGLPGATAVVSFRRGMQTLTDALAGHLPAESKMLGARVRVAFSGRKLVPWRVGWDTPQGLRYGDFERVISALPAWALAALEIGEPGRRPLDQLSLIEHPPLASVFVGYRREDVAHPLDGFGALVPATEGRSVLGIIFSSSLFPGRAPAGHVALTALVGGALQPDLAKLPAKELEARVRADLGDLLGARGEPAFVRHHAWPRSIPQYNLGYGSHLAAMGRCEDELEDFFIGGIARDGIAVPDAVAAGESLARRALG
jgi:oxygen-dependent protoporphyrinogen oxidase